jgi:hypothetical protein
MTERPMGPEHVPGHRRQVEVQYWHQPIRYRPICSCGYSSIITKSTIPDARALGRTNHPQGGTA